MTTAAIVGASIGGLAAALAWPAIAFLIAGVLMGAVVGILPGLSGAAMLAMVLPFAVGLSPTAAFALMIGISDGHGDDRRPDVHPARRPRRAGRGGHDRQRSPNGSPG